MCPEGWWDGRRKSEAALYRLKTSVLAFVSSFAPHTGYYIRPETVPSTTNAHTWCEFQYLKELKEEYKKANLAWPRTWVIYEDNTTKDNKNNFRYWWLSLLVKYGIFDRIIVVYFDVGVCVLLVLSGCSQQCV